jgi:hypothetical protein
MENTMEQQIDNTFFKRLLEVMGLAYRCGQ